MIKTRNLYICTTQYQILNCLEIANGMPKDEENDILLLEQGNSFFKQLNLDKMNMVFSNCFQYTVCKIRENTFKRFLFWGKQLIKRDSYGMDFKERYKNIFISGTEMHSKIVAMKYEKKGSKIQYFEDGLASYDAVLNYKTKYKQDTILKIIFGKRPLDVCQNLYIHKPELVRNNTFSINLIDIKNSKKYYMPANAEQLFSSKCTKFNKKFIFLNAWFLDNEMYIEQQNYIDKLELNVSNDYCIKKHPNDTREINIYKDKIEDCGNFELANFLFDMSDNVFISIISTACITPFLLFDRVPYVIFLYKIFMNKFKMKNWEETSIVLENFILTNNLENKVYIPNTMEEYEQLLKKLKK